MKNRIVKILSVALAACTIAGTASGCSKSTGNQGAASVKHSITWYSSRPVDGAIEQTVKEIAEQYKQKVDKDFSLNIETTSDRPSYLQKLKTLVASNQMPDIIDTDADPYAKELVNKGLLVDVKKYLNDKGLYSKYYPIALKYQEFSDGTMYTLPLEYHVEMTWYNKNIFKKYNVSVPKTLDDLLKVCATLKKNGVTPISVDGVDRWPVLRYTAMVPFRLTGNQYILNLREGKASMKDDAGEKALTFTKEIGTYFNQGFESTDYATAQSMFLQGKSAMYYIGDWEIAAMLDEYKKGNIDYFYLPTTDGATTKPNEFCVNSGIGMAFNQKTFNSVEPFITYLINNYGKLYSEKQQMSPIKTDLADTGTQYSDLYKRIKSDMDKTGDNFLKPWDTYFDPDTLSVFEDNVLLVADGRMSTDSFADLIDSKIKVNAPKYFK